jgi:chitinase
LGGLLIWAIDLDTDNLDALRAVLYPGKLNAFNSDADKVSYWEDAVAGDCRVTECGGKCKAGEIPITTQPCGDATAVFRHSSEDDSTLCCPVSAAPDPKKCRWDGGATGAPSCNGQCNPGEVALQSNKWGDGKYCEDGQYSNVLSPLYDRRSSLIHQPLKASSFTAARFPKQKISIVTGKISAIPEIP